MFNFPEYPISVLIFIEISIQVCQFSPRPSRLVVPSERVARRISPNNPLLGTLPLPNPIPPLFPGRIIPLRGTWNKGSIFIGRVVPNSLSLYLSIYVSVYLSFSLCGASLILRQRVQRGGALMEKQTLPVIYKLYSRLSRSHFLTIQNYNYLIYYSWKGKGRWISYKRFVTFLIVLVIETIFEKGEKEGEAVHLGCLFYLIFSVETLNLPGLERSKL